MTDDEIFDRIDELGRVTHFTSEVDGSLPDCGIALGLGGDRTLYIGEITREQWEAGEVEARDLGGDGGFWLVVDEQPVARFGSWWQASEFVEMLAGLITSGAAVLAREAGIEVREVE